MVSLIAYLEQELVTAHGDRAPTSMDPASAFGLLVTAIKLTSSCLQLCQIGPSKHSQDYLQSLSEQLWSFNGSLKNLETHYKIYEAGQARSILLPSIEDPLSACKIALDAIREHLESRNPIKRFVRGAHFDAVLERHLIRLRNSRILFHEALQADQLGLISAVEKYTINIAEDIRDLQKNVSGIDEHNRKDFEQVHGSLGSIQNGQKDILRSHEDSRARHESRTQVKKDRTIMDWLYPLNFEAKQIDVLSSRSDSTGTWILETEEFKDWSIGPGKTLWCTGIPGAGKTVVASIAVDHLRGKLKGQRVAISCVYCSYKDQAIQTPTSLIASILYQTLTVTKFISDNLRALYERHELNKTRPTLEELSAELQASVRDLEKFFVVIDAIDECPRGTREPFLDRLRKLQPAANLMITTRPASHVVNGFLEAACVEIRAKDTDVRRYCEAKILSDDRLRFMREDDSLKNDVICKLVQNAQNMFLLAVLHLESLASQLNPADVRNALKKLPKRLDDTYHEALQRIAHQGLPYLKMANNVLSWISHAYRPLTVEELQCALAVTPGLTAFDEDAMTPLDTLVSVCGGLVTFDPQSRIIRLVHYTTQEFLENVRDSRFPTAHADITRTCLTYLSFDHPRYYDDRYRAIIHNIKGSPFLRYAAQHWRGHMRASPDTNFNELILQILWHPLKVQCIFQAMDDQGLKLPHIYKDSNVPPLCAAAILGLESIVLLLLERGADLTGSMMSHGGTAFDMAVKFGQLEVIKVLIARGASVNSNHGRRWSPLTRTISTAISTNEKRAVATARLLLDRGADINFQGSFCPDLSSALMEAANYGYVHLVELLLTNNADVNLGASTALHRAHSEKPRISELLIHHGADLEARDYNGKSPLLSQCGSARPNAEETVRLLLKHGADIHSRDNYGEAALFKAAAKGLCRIIKVLMEYGADIHARSKLGRSVLFTASESYLETDETVSLLLDLGVDIHLQDFVGDTALTLAAAKGEPDAVKLLLDHGANPHTKNEAGDTALTLAATAEATLKRSPYFDEGESWLDEATQLAAVVERNLKTLELLLIHGASVDVKNKPGDTALILAAAKGKLDAVKLLLNHKANLHTKNEAGNTALSLSAENGHSEVHQLLLDHLSEANHTPAPTEDE